MSISKKEVGKNVKSAREIKSKNIGYKYTQLQLANDIKSSQGYISDIELGRTYPSSPIAFAIAEACGVSLDFIMGTENKDLETNKPEALENIKKSFSEMLNIVYLPVISKVFPGKLLISEENIETYIPYPKEYDSNKHFVYRVPNNDFEYIGIVKDDLVVIRKQNNAENGQIAVIRTNDKGLVLNKLYEELEPGIAGKDIIGVAIAVTKKLD